MTLISNTIKAAWRSKVDDLTIDLGHICRLVFDSGITEVTNVSVAADGLRSRTILPLGGRGQGFKMPGNPTLSEKTTNTTDHLQANEAVKDIRCRVYSRTLSELLHYNITVNKDVNLYELVTHHKYMPDIIRAKHAILYLPLKEQTIKVKLNKPPVPHGLGDLHECRSFWEEFS